MVKRRFSGEEEVKMCEEYLAGASRNALARKYQTEVITVRRTLNRNGIKSRGNQGRPRALSPEVEAEICRLYVDTDATLTHLMKRFNTSHARVLCLLRREGLLRSNKLLEGGKPRANWKDGRVRSTYGYWLQAVSPDDPYVSMATQTGYVLEHRLAMARHLGRPLTANEIVHHINGNREDNRLENLQLLHKGGHPMGGAIQCQDCGSFNLKAVPIPK